MPDELIDAVMANVDAGGVELLGGVLAELTKRIFERGLAEELTDHLGYESGDPGGRGSGTFNEHCRSHHNAAEVVNRAPRSDRRVVMGPPARTDGFVRSKAGPWADPSQISTLWQVSSF